MTKFMLWHNLLQVCDRHFHIQNGNLRVRHQQLLTRLQILPLLVVVQMVLQILLVWMLWNQNQQVLLLSWLALMWGVHFYEFKSWQRFKAISLHTT